MVIKLCNDYVVKNNTKKPHKKSKDECESKLKFYIVMSNTIFYIL